MDNWKPYAEKLHGLLRESVELLEDLSEGYDDHAWRKCPLLRTRIHQALAECEPAPQGELVASGM